MRMPLTTVILQNVLYAVRRKPVGDIRDGQHTPSVRELVRIADILVPTIFRMEPVPSVVTPVRTAIPKKYIRMRTYLPDIISTVTLQAVIPAERQLPVGDIRAGAAAPTQHLVRLLVLTVNIPVRTI